MNQIITLVLVVFLCCSSVEFSYSQATNEDSAIEYARLIYSTSISDQSGLYDGPEYTGYPYPISVGQPFFQTDSVSRGEVYYNGMLYKNVPMWYDLVKNELVVRYSNNFSKISLHSSKISYFSILGHQFFRIDSAAARLNNIDEGFYDRIYKGRSEVIVRRSKGMLKTTNMEGIWISILNQRNEIYVVRDGRYYPVTNEKSAFRALDGVNAREIQARLKRSKIKFRKDREKAVVLMVSVYDELNK